MKHVSKILVSIIAIALLYGCAQQEEAHPLHGTWKMISGEYIDLENDLHIQTDDSTRFSIKIMSPEHFAVVEMFRDKPDSLFFAAVGTYRIEEGKYIEQYEASNVGYQVGTEREFQYSLENDRWIISAKDEGFELHEEWVKIAQR